MEVPDIRKLTREEILHEAQQLSLQLDSHQSTEKLRTKLASSVFEQIADGLAIRDFKYILDQCNLIEKRNERKRGVLKKYYFSDFSENQFVL